MDGKWRAGNGQTIDRLYAWVAEQSDGEAIVACSAPSGLLLPMIGADRELIESFRDNVVTLASDLKIAIQLKVYVSAGFIDHVHPSSSKGPFW